MKKTFRTILAGAVAVLAVSCYDDSALNSKIDKLDERVTAIENTLNAEVGGINDLVARLAAAETSLGTLNTDVANLKTQVASIITRLDAVDGELDGIVEDYDAAIAELVEADGTISEDLAEAIAKIAVVGVKEVDGNVVITLADGTEVSLSKPLSNVDNTGLVTIVPTDEGDFWAVVNADGTTTLLDVKVGLDLQFQVREGELLYSVDGQEWISTGVTTADLSGQNYLINEVEHDIVNNVLTLTIGQMTYQLPVYTPSLALQVKSGKQYFKNSETKSIPLELENVSKLYVMNQPYGWIAEVKGSSLVVTAPSATNTDAQLTGVVVLHGDDAAGKCVTAVLNVEVGEGFQMWLDEDTGRVCVYNPEVLTVKYPFGGESTDFMSPAIGIVTPEVFAQFDNVEELHTAVERSEGDLGSSGYLYNVDSDIIPIGTYVPEVFEVDEFSFTIDTLGLCFYPRLEIVKGDKYVLYALPQDADGFHPENAQVIFYEPIFVEYTELEKSHAEITYKIDLYGAEKVYVGAIPANTIDGEDFETLKDYMEVGYGFGGPWAQMKQYGMEALGDVYENGDTFSLAEELNGLTPNTEYIVWMMPDKPGKGPADYVYETDFEPYVFKFKTNPLVEGADAAEIALAEQTYDAVHVNVVIPEGVTTYYYFMSDVDPEATNEELAIKVISYGEELEESGIVKETYMDAGESTTLFVLTLTEDGKYALVQGTYSAKNYPVVETITATLESITPDATAANTYTAVFNVTGATKFAMYLFSSSSFVYFNKYLFSKSASLIYADVVDGKATVTFTKNPSYYMIYAGYNEDTEGTVTELSAYQAAQISANLPSAE